MYLNNLIFNFRRKMLRTSFFSFFFNIRFLIFFLHIPSFSSSFQFNFSFSSPCLANCLRFIFRTISTSTSFLSSSLRISSSITALLSSSLYSVFHPQILCRSSYILVLSSQSSVKQFFVYDNDTRRRWLKRKPTSSTTVQPFT